MAKGKLTWTKYDQQELERMQDRRAQFYAENRKPLVNAILDSGLVYNANDSASAANVADILIHRADQFRDLLEPFDSGERAPTAKIIDTEDRRP